MKEENMHIAIEKMKIAHHKKVPIKVVNTDKSNKTVVVEEGMTASMVCHLLVVKNHYDESPNWTVVEQLCDVSLGKWCVCVCVRGHSVCMSVCAVCMGVCLCTSIHARTYAHTYKARMYTHAHMCFILFVHTSIHTYIHKHIHTCIHKHIHTCIHISTLIWMHT